MGMWVPVIPYEYARYLAVAIMAAFDSVMGALNSLLKDEFDIKIFTSGFFVNAVIAIVLTYLGDSLDANIFLAAIFVFVYRIFNNFSSIRRCLINKGNKKQNEDEKVEDKSTENWFLIYIKWLLHCLILAV